MQPTLFVMNHPDQPAVDFAGADYVAERDRGRLQAQAQRVYDAMSDGKWHTLKELEAMTGDPHASISAQIRHLRRAGYKTVKEYRGDGLYVYRLVK